MIYLLRRRGLGKTSCKGIVDKSAVGIQVLRSDRPLPDDAGLVIRWGCTATINANETLNKAKAIHVVSDKSEFRRALNERELCPTTWFERDAVQFPAIVRPRYHSQGKRLWVVNNLDELDDAIILAGNGWYASEIIKKVAEYRVYVAQGRALGVARKFPRDENAIAWNVAQGGHFEVCKWHDWPLKAVKNAINAHKLSGLDFSGVDTMVDADGNDFILEINAAPSLTSAYRQQCFAKVFDYIVQKGKAEIPLIEAKGGYRKFIHPAVCAEALIP